MCRLDDRLYVQPLGGVQAARLFPIALGFAAMFKMVGLQMAKDIKEYQNALADMNNEAVEYVRGVPVIKTFGQTVHSFARFKGTIGNYYKYCIAYGKKCRPPMLIMAVTNTVILLLDLAMLFTSAALYSQGQVGFTGVLLPTVALMSSFGPCVALANLGSALQSAFASGNRVLDILEGAPLVEEVSGRPRTEFTGAAAENLSFSYGGEQVLSGLSLNVPKGKVVGIVGKSGSGKSTFLKLLTRFWQAGPGQVQVSGWDIGRINTQNLRDMRSFVTQETRLFHDSIKNNPRIAKLDATDGEIVAACKKAAAHDFIMTLAKGYDTPVGELGGTLSGGECQRLGLARAFLHDAPLILLDEPTSNPDSLNEAAILKSLGQERGGKTVV